VFSGDDANLVSSDAAKEAIALFWFRRNNQNPCNRPAMTTVVVQRTSFAMPSMSHQENEAPADQTDQSKIIP
jgi:hypothetical protein